MESGRDSADADGYEDKYCPCYSRKSETELCQGGQDLQDSDSRGSQGSEKDLHKKGTGKEKANAINREKYAGAVWPDKTSGRLPFSME